MSANRHKRQCVPEADWHLGAEVVWDGGGFDNRVAVAEEAAKERAEKRAKERAEKLETEMYLLGRWKCDDKTKQFVDMWTAEQLMKIILEPPPPTGEKVEDRLRIIEMLKLAMVTGVRKIEEKLAGSVQTEPAENAASWLSQYMNWFEFTRVWKAFLNGTVESLMADIKHRFDKNNSKSMKCLDWTAMYGFLSQDETANLRLVCSATIDSPYCTRILTHAPYGNGDYSKMITAVLINPCEGDVYPDLTKVRQFHFMGANSDLAKLVDDYIPASTRPKVTALKVKFLIPTSLEEAAKIKSVIEMLLLWFTDAVHVDLEISGSERWLNNYTPPTVHSDRLVTISQTPTPLKTFRVWAPDAPFCLPLPLPLKVHYSGMQGVVINVKLANQGEVRLANKCSNALEVEVHTRREGPQDLSLVVTKVVERFTMGVSNVGESAVNTLQLPIMADRRKRLHFMLDFGVVPPAQKEMMREAQRKLLIQLKERFRTLKGSVFMVNSDAAKRNFQTPK